MALVGPGHVGPLPNSLTEKRGFLACTRDLRRHSRSNPTWSKERQDTEDAEDAVMLSCL